LNRTSFSWLEGSASPEEGAGWVEDEQAPSGPSVIATKIRRFAVGSARQVVGGEPSASGHSLRDANHSPTRASQAAVASSQAPWAADFEHWAQVDAQMSTASS
jgi:hypothetical protein